MSESSNRRWLAVLLGAGLAGGVGWIGCGVPDDPRATARARADRATEPGDGASEPCAGLGLCIHVDLSRQQLRAYGADGELALESTVATGRLETPSRPGSFSIGLRLSQQVMRGPNGDGTDYAVPTHWVQYFDGERAFHSIDSVGDRQSYFGVPRSHGCVNMRESDARALWDLTQPRCRRTGAGSSPAPQVPVKVTGETPFGCFGDICGYGHYCADATEDPCRCGEEWIGPRQYCWQGSTEPCFEGACCADSVCVRGFWLAATRCADIVAGRVCRSGWCDWPGR